MKKIFLLCALSFIMSACIKARGPIRLSIIGDSFSAFEGYVDPDTNDTFYYYDEIGVTGVEQMWWSQVIDSTGWVMERNNSFSGSLVCNYRDFNGGDYFAPNSFIRRMDNLGNPDVIFVFGATNDICKRAPLGDFIYDNWTEEQLCTFRPGMACLLDNVKRMYPKAEVYLLVDMDLCIDETTIEPETRQACIDSMHRIASHYNVNCIDLYEIQKSWGHPDLQGQEDIARQVIEVIWPDVNA